MLEMNTYSQKKVTLGALCTNGRMGTKSKDKTPGALTPDDQGDEYFLKTKINAKNRSEQKFTLD